MYIIASATEVLRAASPYAARSPSCGLVIAEFFETLTFSPLELRTLPPLLPGTRTTPKQFLKRYKSLTRGTSVRCRSAELQAS